MSLLWKDEQGSNSNGVVADSGSCSHASILALSFRFGQAQHKQTSKYKNQISREQDKKQSNAKPNQTKQNRTTRNLIRSMNCWSLTDSWMSGKRSRLRSWRASASCCLDRNDIPSFIHLLKSNCRIGPQGGGEREKTTFQQQNKNAHNRTYPPFVWTKTLVRMTATKRSDQWLETCAEIDRRWSGSQCTFRETNTHK